MDRFDIRELIDSFRLYFPSISKNVSKYYPISTFELIVKLNDGTMMSYYDLDHTIRKLPNKNNMTEDECRYEFGLRLRRLMSFKGITQVELSETTGISRTTISDYITGKVTPNFYNASKIAKALKCSLEELNY